MQHTSLARNESHHTKSVLSFLIEDKQYESFTSYLIPHPRAKKKMYSLLNPK